MPGTGLRAVSNLPCVILRMIINMSFAIPFDRGENWGSETSSSRSHGKWGWESWSLNWATLGRAHFLHFSEKQDLDKSESMSAKDTIIHPAWWQNYTWLMRKRQGKNHWLVPIAFLTVLPYPVGIKSCISARHEPQWSTHVSQPPLHLQRVLQLNGDQWDVSGSLPNNSRKSL